MIIGIGSDLCNIERIENSLERFGERFLNRVFTDVERAKAQSRPHTRAGTLAKRFAAKEAFSKAVGTGFKRGVYITPFWEENFAEIVEIMGADRCAFGSDWPHPEGLSDPITYVDDLKDLAADDVAKIMGGNLMELMKVKAPVPA